MPFQRGEPTGLTLGVLFTLVWYAMASTWGESGPPLVLGFDPKMVIGDRVDLVAELISVSEGSLLTHLCPCGSKARFTGSFDIPEECQAVTIFGCVLIDKDAIVTFQVPRMDDVICHRRCARDDMWNVVELCAGIGVGTFGFDLAGMKTVCAVDWCQPFTDAFQEVHPGTPVVTGDISSNEVLKKVHQTHPHPTAMMCGFSCQPFSSGGQQLGAGDARSASLPSTLRAAYLLRSVALILECVQNAGSNNMVRSLIDSFSQQCRYHVSEVILRLEEVWVSRRSRWWAVLTAQFLGPVSLPGFRASEHPTIPKDLFQSPLVLTPAELDQLVLQGPELEKFLAYESNMGRLFLKLDGKAPTALHSWGSQMVGCHCGCRASGFSHETLSSRGVYGVLVPLPELGSASDSSLPMLRHPHPTEVALLNGVPEITWPCDLRLTLAGLGQMAAPFQTMWIGAHLQRHVDVVFHGSSVVDPQDLVERLSDRMFQLVNALSFLPVQPVDLPEPPVMDFGIPMDDPSLTPWVLFQHVGAKDEVTVVHDTDQVPYVVKLSTQDDTIAAVISASVDLMDFDGMDIRVLDCGSGLELSMDHPAAGMCVWITKQCPAPACLPQVVHVEPESISPTIAWVADEPQGGEVPAEPAVMPVALEASVSPSVLEPLSTLDAERLLLVSEPSVNDCALMQALRNQTMSSSARKQILCNQGTVWADDEMCYHMHQMLAAANKPTWAVLDPLLCAEAIKRPSAGLIGQWLRSLDFKPSAILGVVCADQHWTPFLWTWTPHCTIAASWDVPGSPNRGFSSLHQAIATAVGSRTFTVHVVHRKFAIDRLCGICAIRFIDSMLRGKMLPTADDEAYQLHAIGRSLFVAHLDSLDTVPRPWLFGAGLDPKSSDRLHSHLSDHGVDQTQVKQRASLLIQAIGLAATQQAVTSGQPWRALKAAANHCRPPFQIVLPAELEAVVSKK